MAATAFVLLASAKPQLLDKNAVIGTPEDILSEDATYRMFCAEGICDAALCEVPKISNRRDAQIFLTNPESNSVYIRAEIYSVVFIYDDQGQITSYYHDKLLGKTGFIRPGEYVETLRLDKKLSDDSSYALIKIATYNPDNETSNGAFFINTILYK